MDHRYPNSPYEIPAQPNDAGNGVPARDQLEAMLGNAIEEQMVQRRPLAVPGGLMGGAFPRPLPPYQRIQQQQQQHQQQHRERIFRALGLFPMADPIQMQRYAAPLQPVRLPNGDGPPHMLVHHGPQLGNPEGQDWQQFIKLSDKKLSEAMKCMQRPGDGDDYAMEERLTGACDGEDISGGNLDISGDVISYVAKNRRPGQFRAHRPLTPDNNYFEIEILDTGADGVIGIGVITLTMLTLMYTANDGKIKVTYHPPPNERELKVTYGPKCGQKDRMGCGIVPDKKDRGRYVLFFTKNNKVVERTSSVIRQPKAAFFPTITMNSVGAQVRYITDCDITDYDITDCVWPREDIVSMSIDDHEGDWARLHDVQFNGHTLQYAGKGKSISDVGLAQAKNALNTMNHYFELKILDPGVNCYIAIGIARKNYPKDRHPGWNKGSIAYHADDGKVFTGSGMGDPFGPTCHKGDIMGCGILFPIDYNADNDSGGEGDNDNDVPDLPSDSDDEDFLLEEEMLEFRDIPHRRPLRFRQNESGTIVQVFFTRNGKTIGKQKMNIPKGGFYPTIGMMSSHEMVQVDLHPLTG